jgi:hypothetical protein
MTPERSRHVARRGVHQCKTIVLAAITCLCSLQLGYLTGVSQSGSTEAQAPMAAMEPVLVPVTFSSTKPAASSKASFPLKTASRSTNSTYKRYVPAPIESYIVQHATELGYAARTGRRPRVCTIFKERNLTTIYDDLHTYMQELDHYNELLNNFIAVPDVRISIDQDDKNICQTLELHPHGLSGIFPSGQLSLTRSGHVEPLLPPLRHPGLCFNRSRYFIDLSYLVHDFGAICRQLQKHSRTVLIDMGASLEFHPGLDVASQPAMYLPAIFERFGMPFDHIYAYEITKQDPDQIYKLVPDKLKAAYHWINVAVDPKPGASMNPLTMLLQTYHPDDMVVVKLDVDTPSVERPLSQQLLRDERFGELVDHFYFEHHVRVKQIEYAVSMD